MSWDRKRFLGAIAGGWAGWWAAPRLAAAARSGGDATAGAGLPADVAVPTEEQWLAVRAQYGLEPGRAYFNTGGLGPTPDCVVAALVQSVHGRQRRPDGGQEAIQEAALASLALFLGATAEELSLVRNTTEGNAIIAAGLPLAAGDEVIFEDHAHPGGSYPWLAQARLRGVVVKLFTPDPLSARGNVERVEALLTPRTRVVQVSHVTAPTGIVLPVTALARLCRERGIWLHVDGAQSAGMLPVALQKLGCDSFATSGHKWLGGPQETGVLYVRRERIAEVTPWAVGALAATLAQLPGEMQLAPTARRFAYGTRSPTQAAGLTAAVTWLQSLGAERIAARGRALATRVRQGLLRLPDVEILTPADPTCAGSILTFRTPRLPYDRLFTRLLQEHHCRCRPVSEQGLNAVRVSTHLCNSVAECDTLLEGVARVLRTT